MSICNDRKQAKVSYSQYFTFVTNISLKWGDCDKCYQWPLAHQQVQLSSVYLNVYKHYTPIIPPKAIIHVLCPSLGAHLQEDKVSSPLDTPEARQL